MPTTCGPPLPRSFLPLLRPRPPTAAPPPPPPAQALTPEVRRRRILAAHKHYLRCRAVRSIAWWSAERCGGILESSDEGTGHAHNGWDGPRVNRK